MWFYEFLHACFADSPFSFLISASASDLKFVKTVASITMTCQFHEFFWPNFWRVFYIWSCCASMLQGAQPVNFHWCMTWPRSTSPATSSTTRPSPKAATTTASPTSAFRYCSKFLCKLAMKPHVYLVKISSFSLYQVVARPTKIINNLIKHCKILIFKLFFCVEN